MRLRQRVALAAALSLYVLQLISCGDTFRPVAIPVTQPGGDPAVQQTALVVNNNNNGLGTVTQIDVSGDTVTSVHDAGRGPVHAALATSGLFAFVVNKADNTVSVYTTFTPGGSESSHTVLPPDSVPVFVLVTGNTAYIADSGNATVSVIGGANLVVTNTLVVGSQPVCVVAAQGGAKIYSINQGDGTVS